MFFRRSYGPFIASTLPLRKLMLRVDDRSRLYADAACRRPVSFLRMMHHCIMAPGFQPKERKATEDWLTAMKCQPSPALASQHQVQVPLWHRSTKTSFLATNRSVSFRMERNCSFRMLSSFRWRRVQAFCTARLNTTAESSVPSRIEDRLSDGARDLIGETGCGMS